MAKKSKKKLYYEKQQKRVQRELQKLEKRGLNVEDVIIAKHGKTTTNNKYEFLSKHLTKTQQKSGSSLPIVPQTTIKRTRKRQLQKQQTNNTTKRRHPKKQKVTQSPTQKQAINALPNATPTAQVSSNSVTKDSTNYPTISIVDVFKDKIYSLPNERGLKYRSSGYYEQLDLSPFKSLALSILDDIVTSMVDNEAINYLENIQYEFLEYMGVIEHDSDGDRVESFTSQAITLLKGTPLTFNESVLASDYAESLHSFFL